LKGDFYDLLGLNSGATLEEIKKAYRRLAHQFHPDKNPGNPQAEEHFKRISEAYQTLQDPQKRASYDRFGPAMGQRKSGFSRPGDFSFRQETIHDFFDDFFEDFLNVKKPRSRQTRAADRQYNFKITLEDAFSGVDQQIKIPRNILCPTCRGSRCAPGTQPLTCPECRGQGFLRTQRGFFITDAACARCQGTGEIVMHPCAHCAGKGRVQFTQTLKIRIPAGADEGTRLRVKGEGDQGETGGASGDLYIVISLRKHPVFERQGKDLLCEISIPLTQAIEGSEIEVPTLQGRVRLKVPAGTWPGRIFTLKGKGMPVLGGEGGGDQKVKVRVEIPRKPTRRQREIMTEWECRKGNQR
jgi:molecular chaperone DnaJ